MYAACWRQGILAFNWTVHKNISPATCNFVTLTMLRSIVSTERCSIQLELARHLLLTGFISDIVLKLILCLP